MKEADHELTETQGEELYPMAGEVGLDPARARDETVKMPVPPAPHVQHTPSSATVKRIIHNFTYHAPKGNQVNRYNAIRDQAKELACLFAGQAPESRELSLALTALEEAVMWVNAAIARNE